MNKPLAPHPYFKPFAIEAQFEFQTVAFQTYDTQQLQTRYAVV